MEFEKLLEALAKTCGIDDLEPDESHMVHLGADGTALTIVGDSETRLVVLFSEIGDLPFEGRVRFYEQALKANWLYRGGGATLAINPESDILALNQALPMDLLDGEKFVVLVQQFLDVLVRWRTLAQNWRGAVEAGEVETGELPPPPSEVSLTNDSFALLRGENMIIG